MKSKTGWYNKNKLGYSVKHESHRHALASKGIKTSLPKGAKTVSFSGSPTPNFDMVKKREYDMTLTNYHTILTKLGFEGKDTKVHNGKIHINLSGKWHLVEKETLRELNKLSDAINKIESKLGLTAPLGKETFVSFEDAIATRRGLLETEKLPFISEGFAKANKGKKLNIVFRNLLDKVPLAIGKNFTRENAILYNDLVVSKDALRKLKTWEVEKLKIGSYNMESPEYYSGIHKNVGLPLTTKDKLRLSSEKVKLQSKLNQLLYTPKKDKTDKELLNIVILGSKVKHFDFLRGKTRWSAIGDWQGYPHEKNVVMQVEFKDAKNEKYGIKLMKLLNRYNDVVVGEKQIYARTEPIEESTL